MVINDVEFAIRVFYGSSAVDLAPAEPGIVNVINKELLFWNTHVRRLQTALFVTLGRVFDRSAHSIQKVFRATIENPHIFSKERLAARKRAHLPETLVSEHVADSWLPERHPEELLNVEKELNQRAEQFDPVYREIHNKVFAHRVLKEQKTIEELFGKTDKSEIESILTFLFQLTSALENLYLNGREPEMCSADLSLWTTSYAAQTASTSDATVSR